MRLQPIEIAPRPHEVPLPVVTVSSPRVIVELDDEDERRFRLVFVTYQAVRVTTADCFDLPEEIETFPKGVVEVLESPWIEELRLVLNRNDEDATFMDKARHFLIPAQDEYIEVVAWGMDVESASSPGAPGAG